MGLSIVLKILLLVVPNLISVNGQEARCDYFTAIPREPTPAYDPEDFTGLTWFDRPLLPSAERDDVCMESYASGSGVQVIYIEEEINGDVVIAKLNYQGLATPTIGSFIAGARTTLNPEIRRGETGEDDPNAWYLVITEKQDYETASNRLYMFNVVIYEDTMTYNVIVSLSIVNIDDNPPIIQLFGECVVPELGDPRQTDCQYNVTDADGLISTMVMRFEIEGSRDEADIFALDVERFSDDQYRVLITLRITRALDFVESALHVFTITAFDSLPNTHTVTLLVQVENVEHRPPRWVEIWAMQQFDEKTEQNFVVRAIDSDTGINKAIHYRLINEYPFFTIGEESGVFHVEPIDRDELQQEVFQLQIVAYKFDNDTYSTVSDVIIVVDDVNDQIPEPLSELYEISILEETMMMLEFLEDFGFYDRDLGQNAQYEVYLESVSPPEAASAFSIAPNQGYQLATFLMNVANHSKLDYELLEWQNIELQFIAQEIYERSHIGNTTIRVNLINWNDELPIFEQDYYEAEFRETEGAGFFVATVLARDRDIDDRVVHSIMGNAGSYLNIDPDTGDITVAIDNAFDYLRQNEIVVQVAAVDTLGDGPYNTATAQLTIKLIDVNNNPPSMRLPSNPPMVEENKEEGYLITDAITGSDPDTSGDIYFTIDWDSSYATKQGRQVDPAEYIGCVEILTIYPDEIDRRNAMGHIEVREIREGVTIDFEEFEVLYLNLMVIDRNQEIGDDFTSSTFTIIIEDMNDNAPIWNEASLASNFIVREQALSGVIIGNVYATDIDGPLYNQIRYSISPREDTPEDLVIIDAITGQLEVLESEAIDADIPPRFNLYYNVTASDCCTQNCPPPDPTCYNVTEQISISITDTNNKIPTLLEDEYDWIVYIYENATTGDEVQTVRAQDLDRDEIYNTPYYQINYAVNPTLREFFEVDAETGLVYVEYTGDRVLDRDRGEDTHIIYMTVFDNFYSEGDRNRNQVDLNVTVVLLDVNDNAPELPPPSELSWSISESTEENTRLVPTIYAPDIDEPDTDNSRVNYAIIDVTLTDRDIETPELFGIINVDNVTGDLYCRQDLRGYWGTYGVHVLAYDLGIPQQSSNETYTLVVRPYNYMNPEFVYPASDNMQVRLARERAVVNGLLVLTNNEYLPRIEAIDNDGLEAGVVTFEITGDAKSVDYFTIANDGLNSGTVLLTQPVTDDDLDFEVTIVATDGGSEPGPLSTSVTMTFLFVPTQGDPVFTTPTDTAAFTENEAGLEEDQHLTLAEDPKNINCADDCYEVYYYIVGGNDDNKFALDSTTNVLRVIEPLNRNETTQHVISVAASNSATGVGAVFSQSSILTVTVQVREENPRPRFERDLYTAGISTLDSINKELLTLHATHSENQQITYSIEEDSIESDETISNVANTAIVLNPTSGVVTLNMQPTASMRGQLSFVAVATDIEGRTDEAPVRIFVISSQNRVYFRFLNTLTEVEQEKDYLASVFSDGFDMICNVDQIVPASDEFGAALEELTEVRTHFIHEDEPVDAEEIEAKRSDTVLIRTIQANLAARMLIMEDFVTDSSVTPVTNSVNQIVQSVLVVTNIILAVLCALLVAVYFFKTRSLNRRLRALSTTKFGSQDSGLNRIAATVPGTNKHALEGSNPIWNDQIKAPDFDAISNTSGDSELIGIEDDPQFAYDDYYPPQDEDFNNILNNKNNYVSQDNIASHTNDFNFNPTPFSTEFANKTFGKY